MRSNLKCSHSKSILGDLSDYECIMMDNKMDKASLNVTDVTDPGLRRVRGATRTTVSPLGATSGLHHCAFDRIAKKILSVSMLES